MKIDLLQKISIPEGVEVTIESGIMKASSGGNSLEKKFTYPNVNITKENGFVTLSAKKGTKREKRMINTFKAIINNMLKGVKENYEYKLMICSSHFPMSVSIEKEEVVIKNFLGEKVPRKTRILSGTKVVIDGTVIKVTGMDKEVVGMMAGMIEKLSNIQGRDRRIFQDGCFIFDKAGKILK